MDAHQLHSPFLYQLYSEIFSKKDRFLEKQLIQERKTFFANREPLTFRDPKTGTQITTTVGQLAKKVASSHKFSTFLVRLIHFLNVGTVLETGTSTGLNASCISFSGANVITIEGSSVLADMARKILQLHGLQKVSVVTGNVQDVFPETIEKHKPDLIFLDADHRSETIRFYLDTIKKHAEVKCIVIHDIYWSDDMKKAWQECVRSENYNLTVDIFQAGLIFPTYPIEKQHFSLKF